MSLNTVLTFSMLDLLIIEGGFEYVLVRQINNVVIYQKYNSTLINNRPFIFGFGE